MQDLDDWGCTICVLKSESDLLYALICIKQLLFFYDTKQSGWWMLSLLWVHCWNYIQHHLSKRLTFCPFMYFSFSGMEAIHLFENDITPPPPLSAARNPIYFQLIKKLPHFHRIHRGSTWSICYLSALLWLTLMEKAVCVWQLWIPKFKWLWSQLSQLKFEDLCGSFFFFFWTQKYNIWCAVK